MKKGSLFDAILARVDNITSQIVILYDPDNLMSNFSLIERITGLGFEDYQYADNISLYYFLETYWIHLSNDLNNKLLIRISDRDSQLPFSVVRKSETLYLHLEEYFPSISFKALKELPSQYYDKLYDCLDMNKPTSNNYDNSLDYIARNLFEIDRSLLKTDLDLLKMLVKLHYNDVKLPAMIAKMILEVCTTFPHSYKWDLQRVINDSSDFFQFLQAQWILYINNKVLLQNTPDIVPFEHPNIKIYIDNLFDEGKLKRILLKDKPKSNLGWISCGIVFNEPDCSEIILQQIKSLKSYTLNQESSYKQWLNLAQQYARLLSDINSESKFAQHDEIYELSVEINTVFQQWIIQHYNSLCNLPASVPVMVHQIAKSISYEMESGTANKSALIVIDGLSYDQWLTIASVTNIRELGSGYDESAVFAWIPTLTSISRQAIFSAKPPFYFGQSLYNTSKETSLWKSFWEDNGVTAQKTVYQRVSGDTDIESLLSSQIDFSNCNVVGIVINMIDNIMHGMQLGSSGMHNQIAQWSKLGYFTRLASELLDKGYTVWITSDHGNLECSGIGKIQDGSLAETKGLRARLYQSETLRDNAASVMSDTIKWTPAGLPKDTYSLFAPYKTAFQSSGERIVAHGGISIEEVIVPLVKISR